MTHPTNEQEEVMKKTHSKTGLLLDCGQKLLNQLMTRPSFKDSTAYSSRSAEKRKEPFSFREKELS